MPLSICCPAALTREQLSRCDMNELSLVAVGDSAASSGDSALPVKRSCRRHHVHVSSDRPPKVLNASTPTVVRLLSASA
jgi:hypothetical protein